MLNPDAIKFVNVNGLNKSKDILKMSDNALVDNGDGSGTYFHVSQLKKAILRKQVQDCMLDYKIEIKNNDDIEEILNLFIKLGYTPYQDSSFYRKEGAKAFYAEANKFSLLSIFTNVYKFPVEYSTDVKDGHFRSSENEEITIEQLREMVAYKDELK